MYCAISIQFIASCIDGGLAVLHYEDHGIVVAALILYLDDLLIIGIDSLIAQIKDPMMNRFQMDDFGCTSCYLDMDIK